MERYGIVTPSDVLALWSTVNFVLAAIALAWIVWLEFKWDQRRMEGRRDPRRRLRHCILGFTIFWFLVAAWAWC